MSTPSAGATLYLIFIQVASRALTFIGNQVLLRYLSPTLLGIAVQLEVISVTVLYSARESLRVALQRRLDSAAESSTKDKQSLTQLRSQSTINLSYLVIALGLLIATASGTYYLHVARAEVLNSPDFLAAFLIYGIATIIELLAEPSFLVIQQNSLYAARARAETTAAIARCILACANAITLSRAGYPASVLPFAIGQLSYAVALFFFYLSAANNISRQQHFHLFPVTITAPDYILSLFNKLTVTLAATMYMQSIFKLLLTQGDSLILAALSSLTDQGAFALAANYGGLLARLVFQPIEESSRNTFGRLLPDQQSSKTTSQRNIKAGLSHLSSLIHFYLLASLPLITLIPPLIPLLTPYLFSSAFRTPKIASLLSSYIYYIPFMAINGILDSFVTSVATPSQLRLQSVWMALFTAIYALASWIFLAKMQLAAQGLIWANVANMTMRILWSGWFANSWIMQQQQQQPQQGSGKEMAKAFWSECTPHSSVFVVALLSLLSGRVMEIMKWTQMKDNSTDLTNMGIFVAQVALFAATILIFERDFLISILDTIVPQRLASKIPFLKAQSGSPNFSSRPGLKGRTSK